MCQFNLTMNEASLSSFPLSRHYFDVGILRSGLGFAELDQNSGHSLLFELGRISAFRIADKRKTLSLSEAFFQLFGR